MNKDIGIIVNDSGMMKLFCSCYTVEEAVKIIMNDERLKESNIKNVYLIDLKVAVAETGKEVKIEK